MNEYVAYFFFYEFRLVKKRKILGANPFFRMVNQLGLVLGRGRALHLSRNGIYSRDEDNTRITLLTVTPLAAKN
jgi:hypothetical protein